MVCLSTYQVSHKGFIIFSVSAISVIDASHFLQRFGEYLKKITRTCTVLTILKFCSTLEVFDKHRSSSWGSTNTRLYHFLFPSGRLRQLLLPFLTIVLLYHRFVNSTSLDLDLHFYSVNQEIAILFPFIS